MRLANKLPGKLQGIGYLEANFEATYPEENTNPWKEYFEQGQIIEDLNNLIKSIQCYKDKDVDEIYLTAG